MGSGKTTIGSSWSTAFGIDFCDLDALIAEEAGISVTDFFKKYGEAAFRSQETICLHKAASTTPVLIACGGGTPCFDNNLNFMTEAGYTVYLRARPESIIQRLDNEYERRPLLPSNRHDRHRFIRNLIRLREPFYEKAMLTVDVEDFCINSIPKPLQAYWNHCRR